MARHEQTPAEEIARTRHAARVLTKLCAGWAWLLLAGLSRINRYYVGLLTITFQLCSWSHPRWANLLFRLYECCY